MARFVALLRSVNVSSKNRIPMADLRSSLDGLGLGHVQTYLQSGNVVFDTDGVAANGLASVIRARIARDFGGEIGVIVLTAREMTRVASANPFLEDQSLDPKKLHATVLFQPVPASRLEPAKLPAEDGELAALVGRTVYLYLPNGYGRTKLNNAYFEKALATPATTRNWNTIRALNDLVTAK